MGQSWCSLPARRTSCGGCCAGGTRYKGSETMVEPLTIELSGLGPSRIIPPIPVPADGTQPNALTLPLGETKTHPRPRPGPRARRWAWLSSLRASTPGWAGRRYRPQFRLCWGSCASWGRGWGRGSDKHGSFEKRGHQVRPGKASTEGAWRRALTPRRQRLLRVLKAEWGSFSWDLQGQRPRAREDGRQKEAGRVSGEDNRKLC